jgi:hypothetical protein
MRLPELAKKLSKPFRGNVKPTDHGSEHVNSSEFADDGYEKLSEEEFQSLMADSKSSTNLSVEVVYVTNDKQLILETQVPRGASIEDGIVLSGLLEQCDEVNLETNKVGIYGFVKPLSELLSDGDRIEIYRPVSAK